MWSSGERLAVAIAAIISFVIVMALGAAMALADSAPLMRVVMLPDAIAQLTHELVPVDVTLASGPGEPSSTIKLSGLAYCGSDDSGGASIIAAAQPSDQPIATITLSPADCAVSLSSLAIRMHAAAPSLRWIEVIKARATWQPWRLRVAISDTATAGSGASSAPPAKKGASLSFPTADIPLLPPPGSNPGPTGARFDLAVAFHPDYVLAVLFSHGATTDPVPALTADTVLGREISTAPAGTNAVADAQDVFINQLLSIYAPVYQIPVDVQGTGQTLTARNVSIAGSDNELKVVGQVALGQLNYTATVDCVGDDLAMRSITLDAPMASCNSDDMMAQFRCQAQLAAMQGSSSALSSGLTNYYQGQRFHYSTGDHPAEFTLGDVNFAVTFDALKTSASGPIVSEAGRATIRRVTASAN